MESRVLWSHRMSFLGLAFADDARQFRPTGRDKNRGGNVSPSRPTTEPNHQLENNMETAVNGSNNNESKELSPEELKKYVTALTDELKRGRKVSTQAINAAVFTSCVAVGTGVALTVHHFATKKR